MTAKPVDFHGLAEARAALNADPAFRRIGSADFSLGLAIGDSARIVTFEAFEVAGIADTDPADLRDADIIIRMTPGDWDDYLHARANGQAPTLLSLDLEHRVVQANSPLARLLLERYNRTIQMFLDSVAAAA